MAQYRLLVFTNAADGRDDEFNDWYDNTHLGEVIAAPGITGAERFAVSPQKGGEVSPHRYLAIYDLEAEDPAAVMQELAARAGDGRMKMTDAMSGDVAIRYYEVITPHRTA